jgi:aminotransferase
VVVFSPFYENYVADTILSGAEPIYVSLNPPEFRFDEANLKRAFAQKPKAVILCNPSNPSGRVFTRSELETIAGLAEEVDAFVITDEVYEHIVYAPHRHTYFASLPGMDRRTISCGSLSKTYSITGWRLGYVIAAPEVIAGARKVHDFLTVGAAAPLQEAAVAGLNVGFACSEATLRRKIVADVQKTLENMAWRGHLCSLQCKRINPRQAPRRCVEILLEASAEMGTNAVSASAVLTHGRFTSGGLTQV